MSNVQIIEDSELLKTYAGAKSHDAFRQIVERHGKWVFAAAYRQLQDRQLAEDAAQVVFILLAKRANTMQSGPKLSGWLFNTLQYTVKNMQRMRYRRAKHEQKAAELRTEVLGGRTESPTDLAVRLDAAVERLPSADRTLIVLRYYRDCSFQQIAASLAISEPAARKRVARAVDALRNKLGIPTQADGFLASATVGLAMAPANLTHNLATMALAAKAGVAIPTSVTAATKGTAWLMMMTKLKVAAAITGACLLVAAPVTVAAVYLAAAPATGPVGGPTAATAEDPEKFNKAYALAPGENIKLVPPGAEGRVAGYKAMKALQSQNYEAMAKARQAAMARGATQPSGGGTQQSGSGSFSTNSVSGGSGGPGGRAGRGGGGTGGIGGTGLGPGPEAAGRMARSGGRGQPLNPDGTVAQNSDEDSIPYALVIWYQDGKPLELEHEQTGNLQPRGGRGLQAKHVLEILLKVAPEALEDDTGLSGRGIPGDFVVRVGATPEQIRTGLEKIFSEEFKTHVSLKFKEVDDIVYVFKGKWAYKPVAGEDAGGTPNIHIYAAELGPKRGNGNGSTSDPNHGAMFLRPLAQLLKTKVTMDAEGVPNDLSYTMHVAPGGGVDTKAVLDHITEQTGLTWAEEVQKARHLVMELSPAP